MNRCRQHGFALLLILLVIVTVGAGLFLSAGPLRVQTDPEEAAEVGGELRAGRSSLVVYAAWGGVSQGRPGTVPCPDMSEPGTNGYGIMNPGDCSHSTEESIRDVYVGRLPWETLDLEPAREPVWLAIDRRFVNHPNSEPVNPSNPELIGELELNGVPGFAAVVLAPGDPVEGQTGRPSSALSDYLEGFNAEEQDDKPTVDFEDCGGTGGQSRLDGVPCNDRAIGITAERLLELGARRALAEVEAFIQNRYTNISTLPYAAVSGTAPLLPCRADEVKGRLPLTPGDPDNGGCGGDEFLDLCDMPQWIRPYEDADEFDPIEFPCLYSEDDENDQNGDDEVEVETGNDWLRYITYDISDDCVTQEGDRAVCLGFVETFDDIYGFENLTRQFTLTAGGGGE